MENMSSLYLQQIIVFFSNVSNIFQLCVELHVTEMLTNENMTWMLNTVFYIFASIANTEGFLCDTILMCLLFSFQRQI